MTMQFMMKKGLGIGRPVDTKNAVSMVLVRFAIVDILILHVF